MKEKSDSTLSAYVKLGTIVGVAGFLTVWGVPLIATGSEHVIEILNQSEWFQDVTNT